MDAALYGLEPDPIGFIREDFLQGDIEDGLIEISQLTSSLTDEANDIMNQVADLMTAMYRKRFWMHEESGTKP